MEIDLNAILKFLHRDDQFSSKAHLCTGKTLISLTKEYVCTVYPKYCVVMGFSEAWNGLGVVSELDSYKLIVDD